MSIKARPVQYAIFYGRSRKGRIEGTDEPHFAYEYDNWILHTISSTDTLTERQTGVQT